MPPADGVADPATAGNVGTGGTIGVGEAARDIDKDKTDDSTGSGKLVADTKDWIAELSWTKLDDSDTKELAGRADMDVGATVTLNVETSRLTEEGPMLEKVTTIGRVVISCCAELSTGGRPPEGHGPVSRSAALTPVRSLTVQSVLPTTPVRPSRTGMASLRTPPTTEPRMLGSVTSPTVFRMLLTCGATADNTWFTVLRTFVTPSGIGTPGTADATVPTISSSWPMVLLTVSCTTLRTLLKMSVGAASPDRASTTPEMSDPGSGKGIGSGSVCSVSATTLLAASSVLPTVSTTSVIGESRPPNTPSSRPPTPPSRPPPEPVAG